MFKKQPILQWKLLNPTLLYLMACVHMGIAHADDNTIKQKGTMVLAEHRQFQGGGGGGGGRVYHPAHQTFHQPMYRAPSQQFHNVQHYPQYHNVQHYPQYHNVQHYHQYHNVQHYHQYHNVQHQPRYRNVNYQQNHNAAHHYHGTNKRYNGTQHINHNVNRAHQTLHGNNAAHFQSHGKAPQLYHNMNPVHGLHHINGLHNTNLHNVNVHNTNVNNVNLHNTNIHNANHWNHQFLHNPNNANMFHHVSSYQHYYHNNFNNLNMHQYGLYHHYWNNPYFHNWYSPWYPFGFYGGYFYPLIPFFAIGTYFYYPQVEWLFVDPPADVEPDVYYQNYYNSYYVNGGDTGAADNTEAEPSPEQAPAEQQAAAPAPSPAPATKVAAPAGCFKPFPYRRVYFPTEILKNLLVEASGLPAKERCNFRVAITNFTSQLHDQLQDHYATTFKFGVNEIVVNYYQNLQNQAIVIAGAVNHDNIHAAFEGFLDLEDPSQTIAFTPKGQKPSDEEIQILKQLNDRIKSLGGTPLDQQAQQDQSSASSQAEQPDVDNESAEQPPADNQTQSTPTPAPAGTAVGP